MTATAASTSPVTEMRADAVVIGVGAGADGPVPLGGTADLDRALGGRLAAVLADLGATGEVGDLVRFATLGAVPAPAVAAVGLGRVQPGSPVDGETLRRAAGAATRALAGASRVATTLALAGAGPATGPAGGADPAAGAGSAGDGALRAVAEGSLLGAYAFDAYRTSSAAGRKPPVGEVVLLVGAGDEPAARAALSRAAVVVDAVSLVRDLVNTPPGHLPPARLAEIAAEHATKAGASAQVLDERELADGGFGGIAGVGQGSANPPRLVRLDWRGAGDGPPALALVGKGVTFDSGGLSLKPAGPMEWMKSDMAGAAGVLAAVVAAARAEVPVNITAWMPCAENMPSGAAIRPSDVLTLRNGLRVEVLNTDAEGRLLLGDALARAAEDGPAMIVDVATLTGAQIVALGTRTGGLMGDDEAVGAVRRAAGEAGEAVWPMPMPPDLRKSLDSTIADLANVAAGGNRDGGMLVGAHFLRSFVPGGTPWAHLDIAGPSWNGGEPYGYVPKGGTGFVVRTLFRLAENLA
jgi:leucyl aminopeptidase